MNFSFTFESVQTQTDLVWRYERYILIREYFDRPPLFPPFIIITHIIEFVRLCLRHRPRCKHTRKSIRGAKSFSKRKPPRRCITYTIRLFLEMIAAERAVDKAWSEFETYATNLYARTILTGQPSAASALVPSAARHEVLQTSLDAVMVSPMQTNLDIKSLTDEMMSMRKMMSDLRNHADEVRALVMTAAHRRLLLVRR
jgi:hypothetical protein